MKLGGSFRPTFFKQLLIALIIFFPYLSSANSPYYELAAEVLQRIIGKAAVKNEAKTYLGWAVEREAAIKAILEKRSYDPKVVEAIKSNLETPQKALIHIEALEIEARLAAFHPEWKNILCSLANNETRMRPVIVTAMQFMKNELVTLTNNPASHQNLLRYYREEIQKVFEEVRPHSGKIEWWSEVDKPLATLKTTFQASLQAGQLSRRAREVIEETLTQTNSKLQQGIRSLQRALPDWYVERLRALSQLINGYSFSLVSTHIEGIELEFLLAQIRFGTLEAQQFSFHQLVRHFATAKQRISTEVLREILAARNHHFRQYVIETYKKAEALPPRILALLDMELFRTRLFFPREKEFEEAVETMVALISYPNKDLLAHALMLPEISVMERMGMVRALGYFHSQQAFDLLSEMLPALGRMDGMLFQAGVEVLASSVKVYPGRLSKLLDVLTPLAQAKEPAIRENAIWGLGEVLRLKRNPDATVLMGLLTRANAQTQREIILAFSKLPYSETVAETVRPFLSNLDPDLRMAAVIYFSEKEPHVLYELVKVLAFPGPSLSEETKLLVLGGIKKNFSEIATFKTSLLYLAQQDSSIAVRMEALSLLARSKNPQAAEGLLALFDDVSGSQKRKILIELLTNFEDCPTLRKTVRKIVKFYQDPRYQFDLFDIVGQEHVLSQRLTLLKSDSETLKYIYSLDTSSNPGLAEFIAVVFK